MSEGRVLYNKNNCVKTQLMIKGLTSVQAASCYIQMASWNPSVDQFEIVSRPRTNCLLGRLRSKKYSMISYPREA
jgi:uncharacterized protein YueI